jgi:hypothetical protein
VYLFFNLTLGFFYLNKKMPSFGNLKIEIQGYDPRPRVSSICGRIFFLGGFFDKYPI